MAAPRTRRANRRIGLAGRVLNARPDTIDFRDQMFVPTLVEVPTTKPLDEYQALGIPILDQGSEGACTGFGLATVIHYLLRKRHVVPDAGDVSPWMLYDMARRYDEWPGEEYSGSSARGAMKGWHKHGVCSKEHWPKDGKGDGGLQAGRFEDALKRPLGAYFRVNHKDIVAMHSAMSEVGVLYATAEVHDGWDRVGPDGTIPWTEKSDITGGHAFAIVAYDEIGLWVQNSWADDWGVGGFARITYDDWLANASDVWVARLGAPIRLQQRESASRGVGVAAGGTRSYVFCQLRPHIVSLGNDGKLRAGGTYGTSAADVREIFRGIASKKPKDLLIYAHGGLVAEDSAIQKVADLRGALLDVGVYPLSIIWRTDGWTTLKNILQDAIGRRRPEGFLTSAKDFMLDRLDDGLEPVARSIGGKALWDEMKENATAASARGGGMLAVLAQVAALRADSAGLRIHLVGHSAGSILLGSFAAAAAKQGVPIETCTLWAPACTIDFYRENYLPAIASGAIGRFALFTLTDQAERDDHCGNVYHKSLLYLVSHALERKPRMPGFGKNGEGREGQPILGMARWIESELSAGERGDWIVSPNQVPIGKPGAARAVGHGEFDDDEATLKSTLARVLGQNTQGLAFGVDRLHSQNANRETRESLMARAAMG